ncbi:MAG TPA: GNAT family N-acetyltransferase [Actinomycetales bacterium]|nr:GNAT family N-acetyltransferase [Actinomycetales bacterium]
MSARPPLTATGSRVTVRPVRREDAQPYRRAVELSQARLSRWNPVDPDDILRHIDAQSDVHRTFLVVALDPEGEHGVVGKINVTNVVRGRFQSGSLGYDAYDPYAGRGLFREGLALVVGVALTPGDRGGMGLHRLEASVQPGNVTSAGVLRSLGFRHEGFTPRMLRLGGPDGREDWRDHERYALTIEEWPAEPYRRPERRRVVVLVGGLPGSGKTTLAAALADELGLPLLSKDTIKETVADHLPPDVLERAQGSGSWLGAGAAESLWSLLGTCPWGAVVESWWAVDDLQLVADGLQRAGVSPGESVEVWCDVPPAVAQARYEGRAHERHAVHGPQRGLPWWDTDAPAAARPLAFGTVLRVDTSAPLDRRAVVRLALAARAATR